MRASACLAIAIAIAGCAPHRAAIAPQASRVSAAGYATIVAIRPIGADLRGRVLRAVGVGSVADAGGSAEFILRADAGATLSVVQAADEQFRPGARVVLTGDGRTRLAPPPPPGT